MVYMYTDVIVRLCISCIGKQPPQNNISPGAVAMVMEEVAAELIPEGRYKYNIIFSFTT